MPYPAIAVANEIIKLANREKIDITPMKLQKILYLAYGIYFKRKGERLTIEKFEPWEYGPVIKSVYYRYKLCGGNNIDEPIDDPISAGGYSTILPSAVIIPPDDLTIIKEAWDNAKNLSAFTLSAWSHNKNSPWDKAFHTNPQSAYISDDDIKEYFDRLITN